LLEDKKRSEKAEKWAHEIVEDICDVLRDNTEECTTSEQLMFRKDWVNLQRNIAVWIAGSSDTAWWGKALADIIEAWSCHSWDEAPNECQLCGKVLELDNGKPAFERAFEEHFRAVHWHVSVSEAAASIPAPSLIVEESEEAEGIRETSGLSGENMPEPVDHLPRTEDEDGIDATRTMVENLDSDEVVEHETDSKPKPGLEVMKSIHRKKEKGWTGYAPIPEDAPDMIASRKKEIDPELDVSHIIPGTENKRSRRGKPALDFTESSRDKDEDRPSKRQRKTTSQPRRARK
jgi:hypothetical protein